MKIIDGLVACVLLLALAAAAFHMALPDRTTFAGPLRVVDGDTLAEGTRRVRLLGIDAPELSQICRTATGEAYRCGEVARDALVRLVQTGVVACSVSGRDRYGRELVRCEADGVDLGRDLVRRGLAVSYGDYMAEERLAAASRVGIWAGSFDRPSEWRRAHDRPGGRDAIVGAGRPAP